MKYNDFMLYNFMLHTTQSQRLQQKFKRILIPFSIFYLLSQLNKCVKLGGGLWAHKPAEF